MEAHGRSRERPGRLAQTTRPAGRSRLAGLARLAEKLGGRVALRYWLLQLPGSAILVAILLAGRRWVPVPWWLIVLILGVWIAKDAVLYPWLRDAYDWDAPGTSNTLRDAPGRVVERLDPAGWVRVRGELWRATLEDGDGPVETGAPVRVRSVRGLTVVVAPEPALSPSEAEED